MSNGNGNADSVVGRLSDRELQVLELMGAGKDTKEIADTLNVSKKTVDSFRERMKHKLESRYISFGSILDRAKSGSMLRKKSSSFVPEIKSH